MESNGFLEKFQKRHGREVGKALLREQITLVKRNLGLVEAYQLGMFNSGKTDTPEWKVVCQTIADGEEKLHGLQKAAEEIESQEMSERVTHDHV